MRGVIVNDEKARTYQGGAVEEQVSGCSVMLHNEQPKKGDSMKYHKRRLAVILAVMLCLGVAGCGGDTGGTTGESSRTENAEGEVKAPVLLNEDEFQALMETLPAYVEYTEVTEGAQEYKELDPDIMSAMIRNASKKEIRSASVYFVAWDRKNLPVKIQAQFDFNDPQYMVQMNADGINLLPGDLFGDNYGLQLKPEMQIAKCKAMLLSFEDFDGETWTNPYADYFEKLYAGKKDTGELKVTVPLDEQLYQEVKKGAKKVHEREHPGYTPESLEQKLAKFPMVVEKAEFIPQDTEHGSIVTDGIRFILKNNGTDDITGFQAGIAAWDDQGMPVAFEVGLTGRRKFFQRIHQTGINLPPGGTFGEGKILEIDRNSKVRKVKMVVLNYTTADGTVHTDPNARYFKEMYVNKRLPSDAK